MYKNILLGLFLFQAAASNAQVREILEAVKPKKQFTHILVTDKKKFPKAYMKKLVNEAYANSLSKVKDQKQIISGQTIVKSVSDKKRPGKTKKATKAKKK